MLTYFTINSQIKSELFLTISELYQKSKIIENELHQKTQVPYPKVTIKKLDTTRYQKKTLNGE